MKFTKIFCFGIAMLGAFLLADNASANTYIKDDIVMDTVWTPEMNPIVIKKNENSSSNTINVANGAHLTIQAGTMIFFEPGMSFKVTNQCLRGYSSDECIYDEDRKAKYPKLISVGTAKSPIIFSSLADGSGEESQAGSWGSISISSRDNEIVWNEFRYGGSSTREYFLDMKSTKFENNKVEHIASTAIKAQYMDLNGNVISYAEGDGVNCSDQCNLTNNIFAMNKGNGVVIDASEKSNITNNVFFQNGGVGIKTESFAVNPILVTDNYFLENLGGVELYALKNGQVVNNNNFLKNKEFAIKEDNQTSENIKMTTFGNWFGIDTGSSSTEGAYFVSDSISTKDYNKDACDFSFPITTKSSAEFLAYVSGVQDEDTLADITIKQKIAVGGKIKAGSIQEYFIDFENKNVKEESNLEMQIAMPEDQTLLMCSAKEIEENKNYSYAIACGEDSHENVIYKDGKLIWKINNIGALNAKYFAFATVAKPSVTVSLKKPIINLYQGSKSQVVVYNVGSTATILNSGYETKTTTEVVVEEPVVSEENVEETPVVEIVEEKEVNLAPVVVAPIVTTTASDASAGSVEQGTVIRQIMNGTLQYVLRTSDNRYFILFNSEKWRDIDNFTKGADKDKRIAVFGKYYYNSNGVATGISFTEFKVL